MNHSMHGLVEADLKHEIVWPGLVEADLKHEIVWPGLVEADLNHLASKHINSYPVQLDVRWNMLNNNYNQR